jgi:RNA polymerase sigma factor (sigma-70 family)
MDEALSIAGMTEQERQSADRQISAIIADERSRLLSFIRRRVPNQADAEDLLQEVFYEFIVAYRLMQPVQRWSAWMFRVARNRIIDMFRRKRFEGPSASDAIAVTDEGEELMLQDILSSADSGAAAAYARRVLLEEIEQALDELPADQREVFIAHEIEGYSFKEIAARTGESMNTLLSRKRYAVLRLRRRLQAIHDDLRTGGEQK